MNVLPALRAALVCAGVSFFLLLEASCAHGDDDDLFEDVLFSPDAVKTQNVCIDTSCPAPLATCPGAGAPCSVDLQSDVNHCGACDTPCPKADFTTHGQYLCSDAQCRLACSPMYADCNGSIADGCETKTGADPKNCGGCGVTCKDGDPCWLGACGCPKGFTNCGGDCRDLTSDDQSCGACGTRCTAPTDANDPRWICGPRVTPTNTKWTCASSACKLSCRPGYGDCDQDFCGNGCETSLADDPKNCGACGNACNPGQRCVQGSCLCPPGLTPCGDDCVDVANDPANCGSCGNPCDGASTTGGGPQCKGGECSYVCFPGWADCNHDLYDGCEAKLDADQSNCGACGNACDIAHGQPCVGGICRTKACERVPLR